MDNLFKKITTKFGINTWPKGNWQIANNNGSLVTNAINSDEAYHSLLVMIKLQCCLLTIFF